MSPSKYRAVPTIVDGIRFDSKLEAGRYSQLRIMERTGEISCLTRQKVFPLMVGEAKIGDYVADFVYRLQASGAIIIEDAKGILTPLCRWKLKHMAAQGNHVVLWPPKKPTRKKKS